MRPTGLTTAGLTTAMSATAVQPKGTLQVQSHRETSVRHLPRLVDVDPDPRRRPLPVADADRKREQRVVGQLRLRHDDGGVPAAW
jgi:hypothetical protein